MNPSPDSRRALAAAPKTDEAEVGRIFHQESGRSVAALISVFGDIDVAEDAVQEAFAVALRKWPGEGLPPNPGGWITTTARNRAIDRLRRESRGRQLLGELAALSPANDDDRPTEVGPVQDDRLSLIFTCCHPALSTEAQVALTLRLVGGLSIEAVARSFLVTEAAMAQRLARAKRKIKAAHILYRVPAEDELTDRLRPVLAVLYLVYNAGHLRTTEPDLCAEAIRLARILAMLMPDEPEVAGLLALLLLTESRRESRTRPDGSLVLLGEQDRARWDQALIEEGHTIVHRCLRRNQPGPYQLQAAINAVHADAATFEQTDWAQIIALYDHLLALAPTPIVALNRAIAIGEVHGPAAALALIDELDLDNYHPYHATQADSYAASRETPKPRPPTNARPLSHRPKPNATSSRSAAAARVEKSARRNDDSAIADSDPLSNGSSGSRTLTGRLRTREAARASSISAHPVMPRPDYPRGGAREQQRSPHRIRAVAEKANEVAALLHEAAETHHVVYRIVDGDDPDWASWYADWLLRLSELPQILGDAPIRSHLVHTLVQLDRDFTRERSPGRWEDFYAERLIEEFGE